MPDSPDPQNPKFKDPAKQESINVSAGSQNQDQNQNQNQNQVQVQSQSQSQTDADFTRDYLARLGDEQKIKQQKNAGLIYLPVGSLKFALLCVCMPFQAYLIWWLYRNFQIQVEREGKKFSPLWRINMILLYLRKLLEAMRSEGKLYGLTEALPVEKIVLYWVLLFCCSFFPAPYGLLGTFSFVPFIFVNEYLIKLNSVANPDLRIDNKYSFGDLLVIIFGGAFFAFNICIALRGGLL